MNFDKTKFSCYSLPTLMAFHAKFKPLTEKQEQELAKLQGKIKLTEKQEATIRMLNEKQELSTVDKLSTGCMSELKLIYVAEKYNKAVINFAKDYRPAILNGVLSESKSLSLISSIDDVDYKLHKKLVCNKHLKGIMDAYVGKSPKKATKIMEIKTCENMQSLMTIINTEEAKSKYYWQLMGYLAITGAEEGEICHCVVSYPERLINDEINRFINKAKNFGMDGEYVERQIERIRFNLTFDEIPETERIFRFSVKRDEDAIKDIYDKLKSCRSWLNDFDKIHSNLYISAK